MKLINQFDYPDVPYITRVEDESSEYGKTTTVKSSGCGLCCGMMVAQFFGYELGLDEAIQLSYDYKANLKVGTTYLEYSNALADKFGLYTEASDKITDLFKCLDEGGCVVANVGGDVDDYKGIFAHCGHYVFIESHDGNRLKIWDVGSYPEKYQKDYRKMVDFDGTIAYADVKYLASDCASRPNPYFLFKKNKK